jgi:hypothetical protein
MPAWTSRPTRKLSWGWPRRRSAGASRAPHGGTPLTLAAAPRLQRVASRDGSYLADHVLIDEGQYVDLEEEAESAARYRSARSGPVPRLIPCATLSEELDKAADLIRQWVTQTGAPETIAVLVREQRQRDRLVTGLAERGVTIRAGPMPCCASGPCCTSPRPGPGMNSRCPGAATPASCCPRQPGSSNGIPPAHRGTGGVVLSAHHRTISHYCALSLLSLLRNDSAPGESPDSPIPSGADAKARDGAIAGRRRETAREPAAQVSRSR